MAQVVDYEYIDEVSTLDALRSLASDTTNWYAQDMPWVNTFLINAQAQAYNFPEWWGGEGIAWWSTDISWSSSAYNSISRSSGYIYLPDWTSISITSGSATLSAVTYIYVEQESWTVYYTTTASDAVWDGKILLCVAWPTSSWKKASYQAFWTNAQSTLITADNIAANTITGNEIQANTITSNKLNVWTLSAISADLWTITAWTITWTTITAGNTSSTAVRLNPTTQSIQFFYWWNNAWSIIGSTLDWNSALLLNSTYAGMASGTFSLRNAYLRIPVWSDKYPH